MEALSAVDTVVFDKTGTLTKGTFSVASLHPQNCSEAELLKTAALAESYSNHPIGISVVKAYGGPLDKSEIADIQEIAGQGIQANIGGKTVCAGNGKLMDSVGVQWERSQAVGTTVHVAVEHVYFGYIVVADEMKQDAKFAVDKLKSVGVQKTVMLTGDSEQVGRAVGESLGIDEIHTQMLPDDKVSVVERLLQEKDDKRALAFVGDGINDAPVLARADVGIAMGALGSDAAIEAADIVLMDDKPSKIAKAMEISKKTMRIVRQNITFALLVKAVVLILGAVGLAGMWLAVFADVGVMVIAVLNAMRALRIAVPKN